MENFSFHIMNCRYRLKGYSWGKKKVMYMKSEYKVIWINNWVNHNRKIDIYDIFIYLFRGIITRNIKRERFQLYWTINQSSMHLINVYFTFHPITFFRLFFSVSGINSVRYRFVKFRSDRLSPSYANDEKVAKR